MKKALLFSMLCFVVNAFVFADVGKDLAKNVKETTTSPAAIGDPVITTAPTIFSFPALPIIPPKPWIVATQCEYGQGTMTAFYFDTEAEARTFMTTWCQSNDTGGCNCSLYVWLSLYPLVQWQGALLVESMNCKTEIIERE
jgi:hypothetical protein